MKIPCWSHLSRKLWEPSQPRGSSLPSRGHWSALKSKTWSEKLFRLSLLHFENNFGQQQCRRKSKYLCFNQSDINQHYCKYFHSQQTLCKLNWVKRVNDVVSVLEHRKEMSKDVRAKWSGLVCRRSCHSLTSYSAEEPKRLWRRMLLLKCSGS